MCRRSQLSTSVVVAGLQLEGLPPSPGEGRGSRPEEEGGQVGTEQEEAAEIGRRAEGREGGTGDASAYPCGGRGAGCAAPPGMQLHPVDTPWGACRAPNWGLRQDDHRPTLWLAPSTGAADEAKFAGWLSADDDLIFLLERSTEVRSKHTPTAPFTARCLWNSVPLCRHPCDPFRPTPRLPPAAVP